MGQKNGFSSYEQGGTESVGGDGAIARKTDNTKDCGRDSGDKCPVGKAVIERLSSGGSGRAGIEAEREAESPSIATRKSASGIGSAQRAKCGLWADIGAPEDGGVGWAEVEFGECAKDHDLGGVWKIKKAWKLASHRMRERRVSSIYRALIGTFNKYL